MRYSCTLDLGILLYYIYSPHTDLILFGRLSSIDLDWGLLSALVERWRAETHMFHLRFGECSITLKDVNVLLGIRINGDVVSGLKEVNGGWDNPWRCQYSTERGVHIDDDVADLDGDDIVVEEGSINLGDEGEILGDTSTRVKMKYFLDPPPPPYQSPQVPLMNQLQVQLQRRLFQQQSAQKQQLTSYSAQDQQHPLQHGHSEQHQPIVQPLHQPADEEA
ncbi:hypothetical protein AgCh_018676 [Apium graveolens]